MSLLPILVEKVAVDHVNFPISSNIVLNVVFVIGYFYLLLFSPCS